MAAGATYEPIATTTLGSAQATITFSSIPSTYTDLRIVLISKATTGGNDTLCRFNSDTGTNYSQTQLVGTGSAAGSVRVTGQNKLFFGTMQTGLSSTIFNLVQADIFSYAGSTYKTMLTMDSNDLNGSGSVETTVGLWRSTSAINTVTLTANADTFAAGTTATIYGIKAA